MKRALFVLLITDSGACLAVPGGEVIEAADDWLKIAEALAADPHRPVRLMLNSAEQLYEQLSVKLRNPLDRRRLLARKLSMLSPNAALSGRLTLDRGHYLLAAGGAPGALADALALLAQTGNSLHDITLYPLEAGAYLVEQFPALAKGWSIVTIDSRLAGFHQLVLRHAHTVFGRLLPPARAGHTWQQEIGTMLTYLPRLGLPRETPVTLVANLEQTPLGNMEFPGGTVGELFFLPAAAQDFAHGFLHWHAKTRRPELAVGQRYWRLARFSQQALRTACCATAVIALLATAGIVHLHHRAMAMGAEAAALAGTQSQLAAAIAHDSAADGAATQLRLALALHEAAATPASELPRVKAALAALPPLGLHELFYQRAPFTVRAVFDGDPAAQVLALAKALPDLIVTVAENTIVVSTP